jgi:hypothetical protein
MTTDSQQVIVLRDGEGNFYLISQDTLQSGRVPAAKAKELEKAISGDVAGFFLDSVFQNQFAALSQNNTNVGANTIIGGFAVGNNQSLSQLGLNVGSVNASQRGRA